jgi:hypothetical protein
MLMARATERPLALQSNPEPYCIVIQCDKIAVLKILTDEEL